MNTELLTHENIKEILDLADDYSKSGQTKFKDLEGKIIARCQTTQDIEVLRKMGRPIEEVREMKNEEAVVCSLTGSPSDFNMDY